MIVCVKERNLASPKAKIAKHDAAGRKTVCVKAFPLNYQESPVAHVISRGCSVEMIGIPAMGEK
jgi:hypothetical protein